MPTPSLLVLGTDAALAAAPATPVQLAHACLAAGFAAVIPATWGDELIARRAIDALSNSNTPLIQCSCPLVRRRLSQRSGEITSMGFCGAPPPLATAAYLRHAYAPVGVHITFAGSCPAGASEGIDRWWTPDELFAELARRDIRLSVQPTEFDSILPPDRRRHYSEPGGVPAAAALRSVPGATVVEIHSDDLAVELAQQLLSPHRAIIDIGLAVGCACSGVVSGQPRADARARVRALEPPRSPAPVVDHDATLDLGTSGAPDSGWEPLPGAEPVRLPVPVSSERAEAPTPVLAPAAATEAREEPGFAMAAVAAEPPARRSSSSSSRAVVGAMPQARSSGRQLPRAYVARRRSSPRGLRQSGVRRQEELLGSTRFPRVRGWTATLLAALLVAVIALWLLLRPA